MRLRNVSPLGHLDVPSIGRTGDPIGEPGKGCLEPGEEFDVPDDKAGPLLALGDTVFVAVEAPAPKKGSDS